MWLISNYFFSCFISALIGSVFFIVFHQKFRNFLYALKVNYFLRSITILEITNPQECKKACWHIKSHCQDLSALGFDCEWVSLDGKQRPVALLQLATVHGLCCLFRLNVLQYIPKELQEILLDYNIIKLGISPMHDSKLLMDDYNVQVRGTLDLRFLYPDGGGLATMAASVIGVKLNKDWKIRCSNWEKPTLTETQKDYAAKDAFVAIEIFKKYLLTRNKAFSVLNKREQYNKIFSIPLEVSTWLDINYSQKNFQDAHKRGLESNRIVAKKGKGTYITRKSPLYHNCFMHAPDGELLCSCDRRKAQWYVDRGLAEVFLGQPYSIRLLFEPAARSGDSSGGRFYQHLKQNRCVVCGALDSYLKHNVVPKEYRKHFPKSMKDHQSHDIVLMCVSCHHVASQKNIALRNILAHQCGAPLTATKVTNDRTLQKVKNSARALLTSGDVIPEGRKIFLENNIKKYYEVDSLSPEILKITANLETSIINEHYESHGLKVVNYFTKQKGGLTALEKLWRKYFIDTMKPQYLPTLWSINHNH